MLLVSRQTISIGSDACIHSIVLDVVELIFVGIIIGFYSAVEILKCILLIISASISQVEILTIQIAPALSIRISKKLVLPEIHLLILLRIWRIWIPLVSITASKLVDLNIIHLRKHVLIISPLLLGLDQGL